MLYYNYKYGNSFYLGSVCFVLIRNNLQISEAETKKACRVASL